jgi:hypothetical protein
VGYIQTETMEDGEIILRGKEERIGPVILIGLVIIMFVLGYLDNRDKRKIKNNFEKTLGILNKCEDASSTEGNNTNIEYSFTVNSKVYSRTIHTNTKIKKCRDTPCIGKKYWVIYQKGHPEKSLFNISFEIEGENSTSFPESLDDFY